MLQVFTIASSAEALAKQVRLESTGPMLKSYRVLPGDDATVLQANGDSIEAYPSTWSNQFPMLALDRVFSRKPLNIQFNNERIAIPANCFYYKAKGKLVLVRLLNHRLFYLGGINQRDEDSFTLLTSPSADILRPLSPEMPVLLSANDLKAWLTRGNVQTAVDLADKSGDHWFDYFEIAPLFLGVPEPDASHLKPVSLSFRELEEKKDMMDNIDFNDDRFNRGNSKGR